jgi:hypothetical protein
MAANKAWPLEASEEDEIRRVGTDKGPPECFLSSVAHASELAIQYLVRKEASTAEGSEVSEGSSLPSCAPAPVLASASSSAQSLLHQRIRSAGHRAKPRTRLLLDLSFPQPAVSALLHRSTGRQRFTKNDMNFNHINTFATSPG